MRGRIAFPVGIVAVPRDHVFQNVSDVDDHIRVGVFVHGDPGRGVRHKNGYEAILDPQLDNPGLYLAGDIDKLGPAPGMNRKLFHHGGIIVKTSIHTRRRRRKTGDDPKVGNMGESTLIMFVAFVVLTCCSAFFSGTEAVFFSLNPLHLRRISQKNPAAGARIHAILNQPTSLLSAILIGNTIVNVAIAAVGFTLAERLFPGHGESISIPLVTVLLIVFGEAGPKRAGLLLADRLAVFSVPLVSGVIRLTTPLRMVLERLTKTFEPIFRPRGRTLSEEEFVSVLEISSEEGIINADELAMIKSISRLEDLSASNVMTPRVDLIGLDLGESPDTYVERARKSKRHYLLIYRDQIDNVEGFLDVRKFLLDPQHRIENARIPPFFIPANITLSRLIVRFQKEKQRIAVVVDEYGGTAGVITRGDMLEEITGEIYHELNKPRPLFQEAGPHRWLVDANFRLEELNRKLRLHLSASGADRLAGWIAAQLGHVPRQDDVMEAQGCRVTVLQTTKQRVTLAQIEKLEAPE